MLQRLLRSATRGAASGAILLMLAGACVVLTTGYLWSCSDAQRVGRAAPGAVVDCSIVSVGERAGELEEAVRARDWGRVRAIVVEMGISAGGCSLAALIAELLAQPPGLQAGDLGEARAEWDQIRHELLGGRRFRVGSEIL